jgi:hypothetical protein
MRLQSKGLGKITLPFRLGESRISRGKDCIVFEGRITEKKVNWTYRGELEDGDIVEFMKLANTRPVMRYVAEQAGVKLYSRMFVAACRLIASPFRKSKKTATAESVEKKSKGAAR